jgi:mono/diheme cytochrome c family protein
MRTPMMTSGIRPLLFSVIAAVVALAGTFAAAGAVQRASRSGVDPLPARERWFEPATPTSPELVARGRRLFLDSCAHCHGADARGDEGPDLHALQVSDRYIASTITRGIKGEMPSFARKHGVDDVTALTAYVRSLE